MLYICQNKIRSRDTFCCNTAFYKLNKNKKIMKKLFVVLGAAGLFALSSCTAVQAPAQGLLYTSVSANQAVTSNTLGTKVGKAKASTIICIATGDASVETAAKSAGIKKISHVDYKSENILGLFGSYEVIVYGE